MQGATTILSSLLVIVLLACLFCQCDFLALFNGHNRWIEFDGQTFTAMLWHMIRLGVWLKHASFCQMVALRLIDKRPRSRSSCAAALRLIQKDCSGADHVIKYFRASAPMQLTLSDSSHFPETVLSGIASASKNPLPVTGAALLLTS